MFFYEGYTCPVCKREFKETDDIVACPKCGAPHHRECWKLEGHCHYAEDHDTPRQWKRPAPPPRRTRREKYALTAASRTRNSRSSAPAAAKSFPPRTGPAPRPPAEIPIRRRPASPLTADRLLTAARSLLMASRFRLTAVRADMGNIPPFVCRFSIPTAGFLMRKQSRTSAQRIW